MDYRLSILDEVGDLEQIAESWRALVSPDGHAFSEPDWYIAAARSRKAGGPKIAVFALWHQEDLAAVAPLACGPGRGRYEILGASTLYEPVDIVARDHDAAECLAAAIVDQGRPVFLSRLPSDAKFISEFIAGARSSGIVLSPRSADSPYIDLSVGWNSYYEALPSRIRNILRRASRALYRQGKVDYEFIRPSPAEVPSLLERAFKVELQSWKGRAGSAILQREDLLSFFMAYGSACARRSELLVSFLRFEGQPIAMQIAAIGRGAYRQLKIGYDDRQSKYLPGLQLLLETIRWSSSEGLATYEFMGSREPWTHDWATLDRSHTSLLFYPYNWSGARAFLHDGLERMKTRTARHRKWTAAIRR